MQKQNNKAQEFEVVVIGEPNPDTLTPAEQEVFYTTLLKRISELVAKGGKCYEPLASESLL